jgi:hypothetical protein
MAGLTILRLALAELAHHYGLCKLPDHPKGSPTRYDDGAAEHISSTCGGFARK